MSVCTYMYLQLGASRIVCVCKFVRLSIKQNIDLPENNFIKSRVSVESKQSDTHTKKVISRLTLFSSPEPKAQVSYCRPFSSRPSSVVRRASCVVRRASCVVRRP